MKHSIKNALAILVVFITTAMPLSAAEVVTYYHNDHLGSPIAATDSTGTVIWQQAYDPWGLKVTTNTDERGYTGNWLDEETGLADHKARWYASSIGRFTAIDPVKWHETNIHSFNRYAYSNNNPYRFVDRNGRMARETTNQQLIYPTGPEMSGGGGHAAGSDRIAAAMFVAASIQSLGSSLLPSSLYKPTGPAPLKTSGLDDVTKGALWTSTKSKSAVDNAFGHYKKHKGEFPEFQNAKQYVEGAQKFLNTPPKGTLTKTRSNGDTLLYYPKTNTFGVKDANGTPRTMFRPKGGMDYWNKQ